MIKWLLSKLPKVSYKKELLRKPNVCRWWGFQNRRLFFSNFRFFPPLSTKKAVWKFQFPFLLQLFLPRLSRFLTRGEKEKNAPILPVYPTRGYIQAAALTSLNPPYSPADKTQTRSFQRSFIKRKPCVRVLAKEKGKSFFFRPCFWFESVETKLKGREKGRSEDQVVTARCGEDELDTPCFNLG